MNQREITRSFVDLMGADKYIARRQWRRRSGRTTIIALESLAAAMKHHGRWVRVRDHTGCKNIDKFLHKKIQNIASTLQLDFSFMCDSGGCWIKSTLQTAYEPKSQDDLLKFIGT